jgi:pimeloyl-ACP methyl ester carboxylesterase
VPPPFCATTRTDRRLPAPLAEAATRQPEIEDYDRPVIARPQPHEQGIATSVDGTRIAWYRYGAGDRAVLFVPTWNLVDARVAGNQVAALQSLAVVVTYDPRGAGASERPKRGYDFSLHAADARAVLDANGIESAAIVTASRGLNAAVLLISGNQSRITRLVAIAPYMNLGAETAASDPARLEAVRTDWAGFIVPFMHNVFTEPESDEVIAEMVEIGMEASPDVIVTQELEVGWEQPAQLLETITCPTLVIHGEADVPVPVSLAETIVAALPNARLEVIPGGGHRPDIRTPDLVNPLLIEFLSEP